MDPSNFACIVCNEDFDLFSFIKQHLVLQSEMETTEIEIAKITLFETGSHCQQMSQSSLHGETTIFPLFS